MKRTRDTEILSLLSPRPTASWRLAMRIAEHGWRSRRRTIIIDMDPVATFSLYLGKYDAVIRSDMGIGQWYQAATTGSPLPAPLSTSVDWRTDYLGVIPGWLGAEDDMRAILSYSLSMGFAFNAPEHLAETIFNEIGHITDRVILLAPPGMGWIARMTALSSQTSLAILCNDALTLHDMNRLRLLLEDSSRSAASFLGIEDHRFVHLVNDLDNTSIQPIAEPVPFVLGPDNNPLHTAIHPSTAAALDRVLNPVWGLRASLAESRRTMG